MMMMMMIRRRRRLLMVMMMLASRLNATKQPNDMADASIAGKQLLALHRASTRRLIHEPGQVAETMLVMIT